MTVLRGMTWVHRPGYAASWDDERRGADSSDFSRGTRHALERAWVRPRTAGCTEFQDTVSPSVTAVLAGEPTDDDLLGRAGARAARLLREEAA